MKSIFLWYDFPVKFWRSHHKSRREKNDCDILTSVWNHVCNKMKRKEMGWWIFFSGIWALKGVMSYSQKKNKEKKKKTRSNSTERKLPFRRSIKHFPPLSSLFSSPPVLLCLLQTSTFAAALSSRRRTLTLTLKCLHRPRSFSHTIFVVPYMRPWEQYQRFFRRICICIFWIFF